MKCVPLGIKITVYIKVPAEVKVLQTTSSEKQAKNWWKYASILQNYL